MVSPIQDGANKALKPVRNLFGWFGSTLQSQESEHRAAQAGGQAARTKYIANQSNERSYQELLKLDHLDNELSIADYNPVTATVVYSRRTSGIRPSRSTGAPPRGVRVNDPVVNGEG